MEQGRGLIGKMIVAGGVLYLLLPNLLFQAGWVQWYWAIPIMVGLVIAYIQLCRNTPSTPWAWQKSDAVVLPLLVLGAAFCTASLGLHGHVLQQWDFTVRNPIYETLVRCDWPLYNAEGGYFVYYMAYWLPPALVSKLCTGFISHTSVLWWWNFAGVLLLFLALWLRWRKRVLLIMLLVMMLGSLNDLRRFYGFFKWAWEQCPALECLEPWVSPLADWTNYFFSGLWNQIACCTPHSALPVCIVIALICSRRLNALYIPFVSSLTVLWSPLAAVALLPWVTCITRSHLKTPADVKTLLSQESLWAGVALLGMVGAYFSCAQSGMLHWVTSDAPYYNDWMQTSFVRGFKALFIVLLMLIPLCLFLAGRYRNTAAFRVCALLIIVLPFVWVGYENNELLFKGSAVIFMLLVLLYASALVHAKGWRRTLLVAFCLLSAVEFCWDVGFRILHKYTTDESIMQAHRQDALQGHLNHPDHFVYKNFFGRSPHASVLYPQSGQSAHSLLKPFATGKTAAEINPERLK